MSEIVNASITKNNIFSTIADETISGLDGSMYPENTGIKNIINDTFIQSDLWIAIRRSIFGYYSLIGIFYDSKFKYVVFAACPEKEPGPASGETIIGGVQPVAL